MDQTRDKFLMTLSGLLILACLLTGGCSKSSPPWSQIHGDMANTSFQPFGPRTLDISKAKQFPVGDPGNSSPVELPDGSLVMVVQLPANSGYQFPSNRIVLHVQPNPTLFGYRPFYNLVVVPEDYATPVVDSKGNIYLVFYDLGPGFNGPISLQVEKLRPDGTLLWQIPGYYSPLYLINGRPYQTPALKLIELNGQVSIFLGVWGNTGYEVMAVDANGSTPIDSFGNFVNSCVPSVTSPGFFATAAVYPPAPPFPEDSTLAITTDSNGTPYLIDSADNCGVSFFELVSDPTNPPGWPSDLLYPKRITVSGTDANLGTPAASTFTGYAIVSESSTYKAYNFVTGKKIKDWSLPNFGPSPPAIALNSALLANENLYMVSATNPSLFTSPTYAMGDIYSTVMTLNMIYALGYDGVYAFDTSLNLKSFAPIPPSATASGGQMIVTSNGSLVVASRNGILYIFPPN